MERDPKGLLGTAIRRRRLDLGMDPKWFAAAAGISETTLRKLEDGVHDHPQSEKLFRVDFAARAPSGSCERILLGDFDHFPPLPTADDLELAGRIAALGEREVHLLGLLIEELSPS